ncbi:bifunctional metallophosphatase/5'-nucleotidase [Candidatus Poribacteria bacterium]|nr:bifunctional metallophosphatase/5'-nucleotidase [Candidatus Poribacteria bacterium]
MNNTFKRLLIIYAICFISFTYVTFLWGKEPVHLVILHVNDIHGLLTPHNSENLKDVGGMARISAKIKEIKAANYGKTLVFHAGDELSRGDTLTVYYGGEVNMLALEAAGFEAFTPGNGDFYFGPENLIKQTSLVKIPILHANVVFKKNGERLFKPYIIKEVAGIKVAIFGVGVVRIEHPSGLSLDLRDYIATAKELVPILRNEADLVIALTHIGIEEDKRLAKEVPQIDVIVGGHSHDQLDESLKIPRDSGNGNVIVAQAGELGHFLGYLDLTMDLDENGKYKLTNAEGKLLPIDSNIKEDEEVVELIKSYSEPLSRQISMSNIYLPNPGKGDSPLGNLVTDIIQNATSTEMALLDRGSIQGEIKPGPITIAQVCKIHPWRNRILKFELTGNQLQEVLTKTDVFSSGISYKKENNEVKELMIGSSPVIPDKTYNVAVGEFLLAYIPFLLEMPFVDTGKRIDEAILNYLQQIAIIGEK